VKRRRALLSLLSILGLVALGVVAFFSVSHILQYRAEVEGRLQRQSFDTLFTFGKLTRTALIRGDVESLQAMASLMIDSKAVCVQIVVGEREVLAITREGFGSSLELFPLLRLEADRIVTIESPSEVLDLALPIESADGQQRIVGFIRIAFDGVPSARLVRNRKLLLIGANLAFALALLAPVGWLAKRQHVCVSRRMGDTLHPKDRSQEEVLVAGPLRIDPGTKQVWIDGCHVKLTPKQFALLSHIAQCPNRVFSDRELVEAVWATSSYATSADVKQCVYTLRKRLAEVCDNPTELIANVQGFGYRLSIPVLESDLTES